MGNQWGKTRLPHAAGAMESTREEQKTYTRNQISFGNDFRSGGFCRLGKNSIRGVHSAKIRETAWMPAEGYEVIFARWGGVPAVVAVA